LHAMLDSGLNVNQAMSDLGIASVDESELVTLCQQIVTANPKIAADVRGGKMQAIGALVGQAKKANPNVDPNRIREICLQLINSGS
jgi:aspartyl-tRNA(Asn)/glutamyl-tRNA(Gln) amidotransferase subunit B